MFSRRRRMSRLRHPWWENAAAHPNEFISIDADYADLAALKAAYENIFTDFVGHSASGVSVSSTILHEGRPMLLIEGGAWFENDTPVPVSTPIFGNRIFFNLSGASQGQYSIGEMGSAYSIRGASLVYDADAEHFYLFGTGALVEGVNKWSCPLATIQDGEVHSAIGRVVITGSASPVRIDVWFDGIQRMTGAQRTLNAGVALHTYVGNYFGDAGGSPDGELRIGRQAWIDAATFSDPYRLPNFTDGGGFLLEIRPAEILVAQGGVRQFTAYIEGVAQDPGDITWQATGGIIDANGQFTAGASDGIFAVTGTIAGGAGQSVVEVGTLNPLTDLTPWAFNRFDDIGGVNDDPIDEVPDATGNNRKLFGNTAGNPQRPSLKTNVLNGHDVAEGDGDDDFLRYSGPVPWGARTGFFVGRMLSGVVTSAVIFSASGGWVRFTEVGNQWKLSTIDSGQYNLGGDRMAFTLFSYRFNSPTSLTVWRNNQQFNITLAGDEYDDSPANQFHHFLQHNTTDNAHAQVFDPLHIDSALSDADVARVRRWYNAQAGVIY